MELTNWKTAYKVEKYGNSNFGLEIRVAVDRPLNENDEMAMYKIADDAEAALMTETMRLSPVAQEKKKDERTKLLALFSDKVDEHGAGRDIYVEEIPNGYCSRWCCTQIPWYKVTTRKGVITLGWRKRVIQIAWEPSVNTVAEKLFPEETSTKYDRMIHAWGYEKAQEYITKLLS
jgi:hypothetical protein